MGGLVGLNGVGGTIQNSYATGSVGAGAATGGLVGYDQGNVSASWSSGAVVSGTLSAGLIGYVDGAPAGSVSLTDLYWDEETSGQTTGIAGTHGTVNQTSVTGIGGTTGLSPVHPSTYQGFDFSNVWTIQDGVAPPILRALE
jgi:hypothetical protein